MRSVSSKCFTRVSIHTPQFISSGIKNRFFSDAAQNFFSLTRHEDNKGVVVVATLDDPTQKMNLLSSAMIGEFTNLVESVEKDHVVHSVVFVSGKKDSFIAGADIQELAALKTEQDAVSISSRAHEALAKLQKSHVNFISAIHGACLGGGLEFALACDYRVATDHKKTKMGLPEVQLGLLPGAGGTQRLPKLIGIQQALTLITTGKNVDAKKGKKLGFIDEVADPNSLLDASIAAASRLGGQKYKGKKSKFNVMKFALEGNPLGRSILFDQASKMAAKQTLGNYPAVPKILEVVKKGADAGFEAGCKAEMEAFGALAMTSESAALKGLFFGSTKLKKNRFATKELSEKYGKTTPKVGVLGAGLMGAGIAQVSAELAGSSVVVKDLNLNSLKRGEAQIQKNMDTKMKRRRKTKNEVDNVMSKINFLAVDHHGDEFVDKALGSCDIVVEAVLEELKLKQRIFSDLESKVPETTILATNTSALRLSDIAEPLKRKENFIGMHYFSPVDKMPLLEIIPGPGTSEETKFRALDLGLKQRKTCIVVKDVPGFFVNRCLGPYLSEVTELVKEGVDVSKIDKYMKKYGFPVGPVSLIDEVGVDVALHVQESLLADIGSRMSDATLLEKLLEKGNAGRKAGKGFFKYEKSKKKGPKEVSAEASEIIKSMSTGSESKLSMEEMQERIAFKFINEALFCLQTEVIEDVVDGDIGSVFGVGFPPFRGGPFREVDRIGAQAFVDKMNKFADTYGDRFKPADIVVDYAKAGKKFHK